MTEKRGRPKKPTNTFEINGLITEYLSTKTDNYDNEVSYYKIIDKNYKNTMFGILSQVSDECKVPFWKSEEGEYLLKVKKKYTPKTTPDVGDIVTVNLMFKHYCMEINNDKLLQGYYVKINSYDEDKENNIQIKSKKNNYINNDEIVCNKN